MVNTIGTVDVVALAASADGSPPVVTSTAILRRILEVSRLVREDGRIGPQPKRKFDCDVFSLNIASFVQTLAKCCKTRT